jgi:hypothetical protein
MPRGGRRPGAGTPRGNLNALRTGNNSRRLREVAVALRFFELRHDEPVLREVIIALRDSGLLRPPGGSHNMRRVVQLIHPLLFDRLRDAVNPNSQSRPRSGAPPAAASPSAESAPVPQPAASAHRTRKSRENN